MGIRIKLKGVKMQKAIKHKKSILTIMPKVKLKLNTCKQIPVIRSSIGCIKMKILIILFKLLLTTLLIFIPLNVTFLLK